MSFYASLGQLIYGTLRPGFRILPVSRRVRCLLIHEGKMLLVKNWLGRRQWTLPGGGIHSTETASVASQREMREELGLELQPHQIHHLGGWQESVDGMKCQFEIFQADIESDTIQPNRRELVDCKWFEIGKLPSGRTAVVDESLRLYERI